MEGQRKRGVSEFAVRKSPSSVLQRTFPELVDDVTEVEGASFLERRLVGQLEG